MTIFNQILAFVLSINSFYGHKSLLFLLFFYPVTMIGQISLNKNDIYLEFPGNGIFGSINYERQIFTRPGLGVRMGLGYWSGDQKFRLSFPMSINYLIKLDKLYRAFFDMSIGATWASGQGLDKIHNTTDPNHYILNIVPAIGYRRHTKSDFMWRLNITPFINKFRTIPYFGFSFGKRF